MSPIKRILPAAGLTLLVGLLASCDLNPFDSDDDSSTPTFGITTRRVYVNDSAANDSTKSSLVNFKAGIKFVLQPNRNYTLRVATSGTEDRLQLYVVSGNFIKYLQTVSDSSANGAEYFNLRSTQTSAAVFTAALETPEGGTGAAKRITRVRLLPVAPPLSSSLNVHLFVVGKFKYMTDASRATYASQFLTELKSVYAAYGVTLTTSYEIIDTSRVTLAFSSTLVKLPGTRVAGNAHLYLVDSITYASTTLQILGFSPREVINLDTDDYSRVILSSRSGTSATLADIAAHELGHFLGLRHLTTTSSDRNADQDYSNIQDGLGSTPYCSSMPLSKKSAATAEMNALGPEAKPYCLFTAGTAVYGCPTACDNTYLMHAYYCATDPADQRVMSSEQKTILRQNLAILKGL